MSARKNPVLPVTVPMADNVPNAFGYAIMGILQAKLLAVRSEFPDIQLKTMYVCETPDEMAHTQFCFLDLNRMGDKIAYVTMSEYQKTGDDIRYDLWLHKDGRVEELFVEAVLEEVVVAANTVWTHLMPQALSK
jgi:hypothetical protein